MQESITQRRRNHSRGAIFVCASVCFVLCNCWVYRKYGGKCVCVCVLPMSALTSESDIETVSLLCSVVCARQQLHLKVCATRAYMTKPQPAANVRYKWDTLGWFLVVSYTRFNLIKRERETPTFVAWIIMLLYNNGVYSRPLSPYRNFYIQYYLLLRPKVYKPFNIALLDLLVYFICPNINHFLLSDWLVLIEIECLYWYIYVYHTLLRICGIEILLSPFSCAYASYTRQQFMYFDILESISTYICCCCVLGKTDGAKYLRLLRLQRRTAPECIYTLINFSIWSHKNALDSCAAVYRAFAGYLFLSPYI